MLVRYVTCFASNVRRALLRNRFDLFLLYLNCLRTNGIYAAMRRELNGQAGCENGRFAEVSGNAANTVNPANQTTSDSLQVRNNANQVYVMMDANRYRFNYFRVQAIER